MLQNIPFPIQPVKRRMIAPACSLMTRQRYGNPDDKCDFAIGIKENTLVRSPRERTDSSPFIPREQPSAGQQIVARHLPLR